MQEPTAPLMVLGVDPAGPEGDRTVVRAFPRPDADQQPNGGQTADDRINSSFPPLPRRGPDPALMRRWNRDPVAFAKHIGVELSHEEAKVLRRSMRGDMPHGRKKVAMLEAVRVKIETALQRIHEADSAGELVRPQAVPPLEPEVTDGN